MKVFYIIVTKFKWPLPSAMTPLLLDIANSFCCAKITDILITDPRSQVIPGSCGHLNCCWIAVFDEVKCKGLKDQLMHEPLIFTPQSFLCTLFFKEDIKCLYFKHAKISRNDHKVFCTKMLTHKQMELVQNCISISEYGVLFMFMLISCCWKRSTSLC